jgi:hypothetical protein
MDLVDLDRYPIHPDGCTDRTSFVAECRRQFETDGALALVGFIRPDALAAMHAEAVSVADRAFVGEKRHNVYLIDDDPAYPADHPRNRGERTQISTVADDLIPVGALRALYDWPVFRRFVADVLGLETLYPYVDPLASLNVTVGRTGEQLGWHFDNSDFAITLQLQAAESGGAFEYVPNIRTADEQGFSEVSQVLDGNHPGVRTLSIRPGTLVIFRGRYSVHRVTPIEGQTSRMMAILSYDSSPGVMMTETTRRRFYGRVA